MPLAVGVWSHFQNSFPASEDLPRAVLNVPACEYVRRRNGGSSSPLNCPSKFAGLRRVIWRRTRSPVPGRMKVPFLSFCCEALVSVMYLCTVLLDGEELTPRFGPRENLRLDGDAGPSGAVGEFISVFSSWFSENWAVVRRALGS